MEVINAENIIIELTEEQQNRFIGLCKHGKYSEVKAFIEEYQFEPTIEHLHIACQNYFKWKLVEYFIKEKHIRPDLKCLKYLIKQRNPKGRNMTLFRSMDMVAALL
jgi:hypothetical protein